MCTRLGESVDVSPGDGVQTVEYSREVGLAVIGAGAWGTSLANLLAGKGYGVTLWVYEPELAVRMAQERVNDLYLPDVKLHPGVRPTADMAVAAHDAEIFVSVAPSHTVRTVWETLGPLLPAKTLLVSATKGIEAESLLTMSQVLRATLSADKQVDIAALSGPSFAREVSRDIPTAVVAAASNRAIAEAVQQLFSTPRFRVYTHTDVLGIELGGALKNVMAIAAGVCDSLSFGANARAALITRGLAEIARLGVAMGARAQTFAGLAGMGDLVLTCSGDLSRNYTVGMQLGQGKALRDILRSMRAVAEGVTTADSAVALATKYRVEMPIAENVYALLQGHIGPCEAVTALMTRSLKQEDV
ncbi:Glycerol-3-phosphate dehydrogenase [NAD(P)+] [Candidatus Entotheonellaceae bacterium PAL068K]